MNSACPRCGHDNLADKTFCTQCGQRLEMEFGQLETCLQCAATIKPGKQFCTRCGAATAAAKTTEVVHPVLRTRRQPKKKIIATGLVLTLAVVLAVAAGVLWWPGHGRGTPGNVTLVKLHMSDDDELKGQHLEGRELTDWNRLPRPKGKRKLLAAALFQPSGLRFPEGIKFTWPLSTRQKPGSKLHIAVLNETEKTWLATGQTAEVDTTGKAATGVLYHFSIYSLMNEPPSEEEPPGFGDIEIDRMLGGYITNVDKNENRKDDEDGLLHFPNKEKLRYAWTPHDKPVALHFPFHVNAPPGEELHIAIDLRHAGPASTKESKNNEIMVGHYDWGVIHLEEKALPKDVCLIGSGGGGPGHEFDERFVEKTYIVPNSASTVIGTFSDGAIHPIRKDEIPFVGRRKESVLGTEYGYSGSSFSVLLPADAPRGWYAFWIALPSYELWEASGDMISYSGTQQAELELVARFFEVRTHESISFLDFMAAQGIKEEYPRGYRFDALKWRRLPNVRLKVPMRRSGWVFEDLAVKSFVGNSENGLKSSHSAAGASFNASFTKTYIEKGRQIASRKNSYEIHFPLKMDVFGPADVRVGGNVDFDGKAKSGIAWNIYLKGTASKYDLEAVEMNKDSVSFPISDSDCWFAPTNNVVGYQEPPPPTEQTIVDPWSEKFYIKQTPWPDRTDQSGTRSGIFRFKVEDAWGAEDDFEVSSKPTAMFTFSFTAGSSRRSAYYKGVATYRRRSVVESNLAGESESPPPSDSKPQKNDDFPKWFVEFSERHARAEQLLKNKLDVAANHGAKVSENIRLTRILREAATHEASSFTTLFGSNIVQQSQQLKDRQLTQAKILEEETDTIHEKVYRETLEGEKEIQRMLAFIAGQERRSSAADRTRPELKRWKKVWENHAKIFGPRMYLTAGDGIRFYRVMQVRELDALDADVRVLLAEISSLANQKAQALTHLRSAIRIDPTHAEARRRAAEIELELLRAVSRKVNGEMDKARKHFYAYLKGRGYESHDTRGGAALGEWIFNSLTTGPAAIVSSFAGRQDIKLENLDAAQQEGTQLYLGLQGIIALVRRGVTLEEIDKGLNVEQLQRHLAGLKTAKGTLYSKEDYRALGSLISMAIKLKELQAIINESADLFRLAMQDKLLEDLDVDMSEIALDRIEFFGDIGSSKNLFMLGLPSSIGTVGGKMVRGGNWIWGERAKKTLAALERAKAAGVEVRTGLDVLSTHVGWGRVLQSLDGTTTGSWLYKLSDSYQKISTRGGLAWKSAWFGTKTVTQWALATYILQQAEEVGGLYSVAAVDAILTLYALDPDLVYVALQRAKVPPQRVSAWIQRYSKAVASYDDAVQKRLLTGMSEIEKILLIDKSAKGIDRTLHHELDNFLRMEEIFHDFVPMGDVAIDCEFALYKSILAIKRGNKEEARSFALAAADLLVKAEKNLHVLKNNKAKLEAIAEKLDELGYQEIATLANQPQALRLGFRTATEWSGGGGDSPFGVLMSEGDALRLAGDLTGAIKKYRAALLTQSGRVYRYLAGDILQFTIQLRVARRGKIRPPHKLMREISPPVPDSLTKSLSESVEEALMKAERLQKQNSNVDPFPIDVIINGKNFQVNQVPGGSSKEVFLVVTEGKKFSVKRIHYIPQNQKGYYFEYDVDAELVGPAICDMYGSAMPAAAVSPVVNSNNEILQWNLVSRWVDGDVLLDLPAAHAVALKDQYADHLIFSLLMGDFDRHLKNYIVDKSNRMFGIDGGMGVLKAGNDCVDIVGTRAFSHNQTADWSPATVKEYMQECLSHHLYRSLRGAADSTDRLQPFYQKQLPLLQSLTYSDFLSAIQRAEQIMADPLKKKVLRDRIAAALEKKVRARLENRLKNLFSDPKDLRESLGERLPGELQKVTNEAVDAIEERTGILRSLDYNLGLPGGPTRNNFPLKPNQNSSLLPDESRKSIVGYHIAFSTLAA